MNETFARAELFVVLLAAMLALTAVARRLLVPYPILLVLGGLALAFIPGVPEVALQPDLVFVLFLPPILWGAAYFTSLRDFKRNLRSITGLALGLVLLTTLVVGWVAHELIPGMSWAVALCLGAIVSPPDAVAATAVMSRIGVPRTVITVLEGESLVNDASALVLYRAAVMAIVSGTFSVGATIGSFFLVATVGILVGFAAGRLVRWAIVTWPRAMVRSPSRCSGRTWRGSSPNDCTGPPCSRVSWAASTSVSTSAARCHRWCGFSHAACGSC